MLLSLKEGILYGPVNSRRLGKSLGINVMPSKYKLCSFNCVYCHFGWTDKHTMDMNQYLSDMPSLEEVAQAVDEAVQSDMEFDYLTFSGNGEPTLYPYFYDLVEETIKIRNRWRTEVKIALLSNSTGLNNEKVCHAISKIDVPILKLDAGTETVFKKINRPPHSIRFEDIINSLAKVDDIIIQTILIDGDPSNVSDGELDAYFQHIKNINPRQVHIYSIDRPVPKEHIKKVTPEHLESIAQRGETATGVQFKAFYLR